MKKFIRASFDALLFSNVFMALCAVAQGLVTFHIIGVKPIFPVLALLFASTLGLYNFCILIIRSKEPQKSSYRRIRWFFGYHRLMVTITIAALLSLIPLFFLLANSSKLLLIGLAALSFGYGLPLFTKKGRKSGLRNVPGLKPVLITLVWTLSCVLLPIFEAQDSLHIVVPESNIWIIFSKRFLFIAALTVPFDIRDLFQDRIAGLKTIPVAFGEQRAYWFCQLLLAGHIMLLLLLWNYRLTSDFFALAFVAILTGWLIFKSTWKRDEYYYFFYLDGVLILQYIVLVLFKLF